MTTLRCLSTFPNHINSLSAEWRDKAGQGGTDQILRPHPHSTQNGTNPRESLKRPTITVSAAVLAVSAALVGAAHAV